MPEEFYIFTDASVIPQSQLAIGAFLILTQTDIESLCLDGKSNSHTEISKKIRTISLQTIKPNVAEIQTFLFSLRELVPHQNPNIHVTCVTDSQTICTIMGERRKRLEATNFCNRNGESLAHADLYKQVIQQLDSKNIRLIKVKGHKSKKLYKDWIDEVFSLVDKKARSTLRELVNSL
ncbi:MAG: RNase H family protein [Oligoflexales bacterium]